jgi:hypothetical protein
MKYLDNNNESTCRQQQIKRMASFRFGKMYSSN